MTESSVPRDPSENQGRPTPGPWRIRETLKGYSVMTDDGVVVCRVFGREDARLIAAAPGLLAALQLVQRAIAVHHEAGRDAVIQPDSVVTDTLAEAIAEATGVDR